MSARSEGGTHTPPGGARGSRTTLLAWIGLLALAALRRRDRSPDPRRTGGDLVLRETVRTIRKRGRPAPKRAVSWGAIAAGAAVALALLLLLGLAGLGWALSGNRPRFTAWDRGWVLLSLAVAPALALFVGGWCAARLARPAGRLDGALHGLAVWAVAVLLGAGLAGFAASQAADRAAAVAGAAASRLERAFVGLAGNTQAPSALLTTGPDRISSGSLESGVRDILQQVATRPDAMLDKIEATLRGLEAALADIPRTAPTAVRPGVAGPPLHEAEIVAVIAQQTGRPAEQAIEAVGEWQPATGTNSREWSTTGLGEALTDLVRDVREAAETARRQGAMLLLATAAGLVLCALAALVGGLSARRGR